MTDTDPELLRERSHKAIRVILEAVVALALAGMGSIAALYPRHPLYSGPVWLPDPVLPMTSERQRMQELLDRIADPIPGKKPLPSTAILEDAVKTIRSSGGFWVARRGRICEARPKTAASSMLNVRVEKRM